jgi:hypothetical protein
MIPVRKPGAVPRVKGVIERVVKWVMVIKIPPLPGFLPKINFNRADHGQGGVMLADPGFF